ncbi:hypothetical protein HYS54_05340 [Candidatus Micrarchaeota archaeon]|nr:hypothetical protein [Candidatus Micrarchaeota archaeon]
MGVNQISLAIPQQLYAESKNYYMEYGYKNLQELLLDLLRQRVLFDKIRRYRQLELGLEGKKGMSQEEAIRKLEAL